MPVFSRSLICLAGILMPLGYSLVSSSAVTLRPVAVVTAAIVLTTTSWLTRGRSFQAREIWENSRCSILFHLLVPGQCRCLSY